MKLSATCANNNSYTEFVKLIGNIFSNEKSLNLSFLKNPLNYDKNDDIGVDLEQVKSFYECLLQQPQTVVNAFHNAIEKYLYELVINASKISHVSFLRQFVILFEYPNISDPTEFQRRFGLLLIATSSLPPQYLSFFKDQYLARLSDKRFKEIHLDLQNFIALYLITIDDTFDINIDKYIVSVTIIIGIIYELNKKRKLLTYDQFYSESINQKIDIFKNYKNWKNRSGFSFCNYPFLLDTEVKSKILLTETRYEQYKKRGDMLQWMLFQGFYSSPILDIKVDRNDLINSSLSALAIYQTPYELQQELRVEFIGEEGVDEGGVQKEWFQLLVKELFDPKYGMFIVDEETRTQWFNMASTDYAEFELLGKVLGLAVYNGIILDLHFPTVTYKKLMGNEIDMDDLVQIYPDIAKGLQHILNFDEEKEKAKVADVFGLTFQITFTDAYGGKHNYDLIENGGDIQVTKENRQEYANLYTKYLLIDSVENQFESFKRGFSLVCNSEAFKLFVYQELELLICGSPKLDFTELEKTAIYENGYSDTHPTILNFWKVIHELPLEKKKKFLFFVSGSDRSPIGGLGRLKLVISRHGDDDERLPSAHTCFNYLLLPPYGSLEKLREKLLISISNAEGFGMY